MAGWKSRTERFPLPHSRKEGAVNLPPLPCLSGRLLWSGRRLKVFRFFGRPATERVLLVAGRIFIIPQLFKFCQVENLHKKFTKKIPKFVQNSGIAFCSRGRYNKYRKRGKGYGKRSLQESCSHTVRRTGKLRWRWSLG